MSDYHEAVRLFLWYTGSKYSFHQGKTNREQAKLYHDVALKLLAEMNDDSN
jgi:hypothetical protein